MTVGLVGLGLIGGSMAKAYKKGEHKVYAYDIDAATMESAAADDVIDGVLTKDNLSECDIVMIALYPRDAVAYMRENAPFFNKNGIVMDLCGVKQAVCEKAFPIAKENGFLYVGAHPMAGTQYSGLAHSRSTMFSGAPMVLVFPEDCDEKALLHRCRELLSPVGFQRYSVTTAEDHDRMIAFTSQLAHVVSNAYIKSPTAVRHKGFSAGSYKDMTRVAWLNEKMWTELFFDNREALLAEIDEILSSLAAYRDALAEGDHARMEELLRAGRIAKEEVDG